MMRVRLISVLLSLAIIAIGAGVWLSVEGPTPAPEPEGMCPLPTEDRQDADAERRHERLRRQWREEMHLAAPDVDWRAIEKENGRVLQEMRNESARSQPLSRSSIWTELGSRNLAGRMHAAALAASGDSIYGGSSLGGVWKASLDGQGWRPLSDNLYGGSHGLAVAAGPPEVITSITDDGLVHYTDDDGLTWQVPAGIGTGITQAKRVLRDLSAPNRVYLLVAKNYQRELYRSDDGGASYTLVRALGGVDGDIWLNRVSGGPLYLLQVKTMWRSLDHGASWDSVGTVPAGFVSRVWLTGSEAGAPTFYASTRGAGGVWQLYRSADGGATWDYRYEIDDYWETLAASITNPDLVLFGGVELWRSTDGGGTFTKVNAWQDYYSDPLNKLHADNPGLDVLWTPWGEIFYMGTDGGLFMSDDGVATVTNISLEYLRVSQYYSTHTTVNDPDIILAGSQDQGYQRSAGPGGAPQRDFTQLISGDYGHLTSSDGTHAWVYSVYPGFVLVQKNEELPVLSAYLDFPADESYSWMPYILADPDDQKAFYFCAKHLYRYVKSGVLPWQHYQETTQDFTVGGGSYLTALSVSPADHDRRMAVTNSGALWYSTDGGINWTLSPDTGPSAHYFYGTALEPSPVDPLTAYVGGSGYSGSGVYRTTDGGVNWFAVGDGLPSTLVYDLAYESPSSEVLYAATEAGPYRFDPLSETWEYIGGADAPITIYWCVEAVPAAGVMRFGTYGRGIWDFDTYGATSVADASELSRRADSPRLINYPNPFNPLTSIRYRLDEAGQVKLSIYDAAGRRVATLIDSRQATGEHEVEWNGTDGYGREVASGLYWARLEAPGTVLSRHMTLIK